MRIGIISYDFFPGIGGQGVYVHEIQRRLADKGVTALVFSAMASGQADTYRVKAGNNLVFSLVSNLRVNAWAARHRLDLVHFQGGPGGVFLFRRPAVPAVFTAHHLYSQQYAFLKKPVYRPLMRLEKRGYRLADAIVAVSTTTAAALVNDYGTAPEKTEVIPDGVDAEVFRPLGLARVPESLLFVGRPHERKGLRYLLEAVRILKRKRPAIKLYLAGSGGGHGEWPEQLRRENPGDNVEFLGRVSREDLVRWYNRVEVCVVPSLFEGFGIVCIEAMACGTPVIGTEAPGIIDIIKDGENGRLVPAKNSQRLAETIDEVLDDAPRREALGRRGREDVIARFDWGDITGKLARVYERALASGRARKGRPA